MIDPRLTWFAMGATFGMVLCGWPWHPRFSRYILPAPRRPGHYSSSAWGFPPPPPPPKTRREYLYSPATMAECAGPCFEAWDPRACDCGALWRDVPMDEPAARRLRLRDDVRLRRGGSAVAVAPLDAAFVPGNAEAGIRLGRRGDRLDPNRPQGGTPTPPPKSP